MRLLHVLLLPLTAITLFAQTPPQPAASPASSPQSSSPAYVAPLFNATTRDVILDAVVTDKQGNVVPGLTRNDFVIREDNTPQATQSFDAVTAGHSAEDATPHTILLVDELNTHFADMAYTRYSVNRLLHHDGAKLQQPTALYILSNDGLHVLQNYTRDPAAIDAALRVPQVRAALPPAAQFLLRAGTHQSLDDSAAADRHCQHRHAGPQKHRLDQPRTAHLRSLAFDRRSREGVVRFHPPTSPISS